MSKNPMFDAYGRPTGADQNSPFQDQAPPSNTNGKSQAQDGRTIPQQQGPVGSSPEDPTLAGWRTGSSRRQLGEPHAAPPDAPDPMMTPVQQAITGVNPEWMDHGPVGTIPPVQAPTPPVAHGGPEQMAKAVAAGFQPQSPMQTEDAWVQFTNKLAGYDGPGAAFDASAGRSGASAAAHAARGNLQSIVDQFNAQTGMQAKVVGGDRVDFGDGNGPRDVIRDSGNGTDAFWYQEGPVGGGGGGSYAGPSGPAPQAPQMSPLMQSILSGISDGQHLDMQSPFSLPGLQVPTAQGVTPQSQEAILAAILQSLQGSHAPGGR